MLIPLALALFMTPTLEAPAPEPTAALFGEDLAYEALFSQYEVAYDAWRERLRTSSGLKERRELRKLEPAVLFRPRFEALADSGSGRSLLWLLRNGRKFAELNPRFGGEPVFMGRVGAGVIVDEHESWDLMILVRYPTRRQFVEMLADPGYQAIAPIRAAALADSRLIETTDLLGTHAGGG